LNIKKRDIELEAKTQVSPQVLSTSEGSQGFLILINLQNNDVKTILGSFGGSNMFNMNNSVDLDKSMYSIPENGVVIKGSRYGGPTYAYLLINPNNMANFLPEFSELTPLEAKILHFIQYKAKRGFKFKEEIIQPLIEKGYVTRSPKGLVRITIDGKNAYLNSSHKFL
jgi:hypothetical protein